MYQHKGQRRYLVEVSKDDYIHVMTFDEKGQLVNESAEKAFPSERASDAAPEDATPQTYSKPKKPTTTKSRKT